jgi:AcrR family transcriptional regulator
VGGRRRPDDYFEVAMDILRTFGFPALTASALCDRMGVTRGSFYHHFQSFDEFTAGLLSYWARHYSTELIVKSAAVGDLSAMLRRQTEMAISLPHRAEVALRAWATINPEVAAAQRQVDQLRHRGLTQALINHGVDPTVAETYATISVNTLIGFQMSEATAEQMRQTYQKLGEILLARSIGIGSCGAV